MKLLKKRLSIFFIISSIGISILLTSCGGGSVNDNNDISDPPASDCPDGTDCNHDNTSDDICDNASGTWEMTEQIYPDFCPLPLYTRNMSIPAIQDGCDVTIHTYGGVFTKTLNNNSITLTGSHAENGGMVTGNYIFTFNGNNIEGSSTWTWTDGILVCTGSTQLSGSRSDYTPIGPGCEDVSGSWHTNESFESESCGDSGSSNFI